MITTHTNLKVGSLDGGKATTQVAHDFNSYCRFGEHFLACRDTGLCSIGGEFGTAEIVNSSFKTFSMKLGYQGTKRLRFIYLGVETEGKLIITPIGDEVSQKPITVTPIGGGRQFIKVPVDRAKGRTYFEFKVENVAGCWFAIDQVSVLPIYLPLGRK